MKIKMLAVLMMVVIVLGGFVSYLFLQDNAHDLESVDEREYGDVSYSNLETFSSFQEIQRFLNSNAELSGSSYSYGYLSGSSTKNIANFSC